VSSRCIEGGRVGVDVVDDFAGMMLCGWSKVERGPDRYVACGIWHYQAAREMDRWSIDTYQAGRLADGQTDKQADRQAGVVSPTELSECSPAQK
jgi:hypothetical protein